MRPSLVISRDTTQRILTSGHMPPGRRRSSDALFEGPLVGVVGSIRLISSGERLMAQIYDGGRRIMHKPVNQDSAKEAIAEKLGVNADAIPDAFMATLRASGAWPFELMSNSLAVLLAWPVALRNAAKCWYVWHVRMAACRQHSCYNSVR